MTRKELEQLEELLSKFRDDSVDREEFSRREAVRFEVEFELERVAP